MIQGLSVALRPRRSLIMSPVVSAAALFSHCARMLNCSPPVHSNHQNLSACSSTMSTSALSFSTRLYKLSHRPRRPLLLPLWCLSSSTKVLWRPTSCLRTKCGGRQFALRLERRCTSGLSAWAWTRRQGSLTDSRTRRMVRHAWAFSPSPREGAGCEKRELRLSCPCPRRRQRRVGSRLIGDGRWRMGSMG